MNVKNLIWGAAALLVMISCGKKSDTGGSVTASQEYPTMTISMQNAELKTIYPVTIRGKEDIEIRPRVEGFIDAIYIDEGSVVKKGQSLFKINSPQSEQAMTTAQAALRSAEAQVNTAKLNVDRIAPLAEKGIVSKVQLETHQNTYTTALAAKAQAEASLTNAKATLGWTNVSSPVDGVVGAIPYRQGSLVDKQNVLTTVANTSNVFAYFSLNEKMLAEFLGNLEGNTQAEKIKNAPEITLTLADGTVYPEKGKIETITGTVNVTTGTANFRVEFPNAQGMLRSGTSGTISIPRILENVVTIPQKATFAQQDKILVYKVQGDSVVQKVISVVPLPDGKNYAVTEGLEQGDKVVTDGIVTLFNGKKITVK
ncbi:membrane fusion protein (multidrug efflux system) [Parabacteroides sp. PF5-5]|uniref:efflux RND transporter periplasmic adaptor subunit n=1 Tax=unclassified Parabacteroides TaxID=2649774 RepID=UPI0024771A6E|nr:MULTISPECIES: efflux RND transporter periplasmic adaptor subunit [unclassified Parabacteroides]MDH6304997.1 membrane fusion protein (multidrug efflux system) [Parabacteroides sp. PH5-39]MDH6315918.1 membrane fusion protein (multidrug efflux system) [Parabacteroides sp. PF5-13]MDH6319575.1 membrane fusion protein (multidrug efflux system) [Parabacteroides sp. PH5-13]MDH6323306.1 membrane fusion protein (multidrug efflux system) [Parabacteroides sp. PH5-8]MDH6327186.1 membrane fusion protein 